MARKPQKTPRKRPKKHVNKPKTLKTMFGICKKAAGWLLKQGFLQKNDKCTKCGNETVSEVTGRNGNLAYLRAFSDVFEAFSVVFLPYHQHI